jgi:hypothetical protein
LEKLRTYYTRLISSDWSFYTPAPYRGKRWTITFEKTPLCNRSGATYIKGSKMESREITINANNFNSAQNALELINCAMLLSTGQPLLAVGELVVPKDKKEYDKIFSEDAFGPPPAYLIKTEV